MRQLCQTLCLKLPIFQIRLWTVYAGETEVHIAKVKASCKEHVLAITWEQKIEAIEKMRERD